MAKSRDQVPPTCLYRDLHRSACADELLRALAHPIRLRLIALLCQEELHVTALCVRLTLKQSIVSQQLRILRGQRLVAPVRRDGFAVYHVTEPRLGELVRCLEGCALS